MRARIAHGSCHPALPSAASPPLPLLGSPADRPAAAGRGWGFGSSKLDQDSSEAPGNPARRILGRIMYHMYHMYTQQQLLQRQQRQQLLAAIVDGI